jgi:hypothetical protein
LALACHDHGPHGQTGSSHGCGRGPGDGRHGGWSPAAPPSPPSPPSSPRAPGED